MTNKEPIGYYQEQTSQIERGFERSEKKDPSLSKTAALGACRIANPYDKVATASSRLNKRQDGASTIFSDRLLDSLQASITEKLKSLHHKIHELSASSCGERPTDGLIEGMPYDNEVLSRYAYGAMKTGGRVLEIGCGLGYGSYFMVSLNKEITQLVSLDYDLTNASLANSLWTDGQHSLPLSYGCAKAEHLPFEADSFDAVVCFEVIEHLFDPEGMLNEIHRVLKNKGLLIGSTPNSNLYPFRINRERKSDPVALRKEGIWPWHYQEFTEEKVSHLLMENGFSHIEYAYPTFIKGVSLAHQIPFLNFDEALDALSTLTWKVSDFGFRSTYYPLFSGYSFIFTGVKNG